MPTPMHYDKAVALCGRPLNEGSPVSIRQMLFVRFGRVQRARSGSYADRERMYLTVEGAKAGGSRYDMWRQHLSSVRPFTDGVRLTGSMPSVVAQSYVKVQNDLYVGWVESEGVTSKRRVRSMDQSCGVVEGGCVSVKA